MTFSSSHIFRHLLLSAVLLSSIAVWATKPEDLAALDAALARKTAYDAAKQARIDSLIRSLPDAEEAYDVYSSLFDEYKSYNYDTALFYVNKMLDEAWRMQDKSKQLHAEIQKGFVYLSAGLFKESADVFEALHPQASQMDSVLRIQYDVTYARLLFDMADYTNGPQSADYEAAGVALMQDAANRMSPSDTAAYWYCLATIDIRHHNFRRSIQRFLMSIEGTDCTEHDKAIAYSSMAYEYLLLDEWEEAQHYNILAAIADIESSTKEAVALRVVAKFLYEEGDTDNAARYIRIALDDARRYNARHRQLEIGQILPIIEEQQVQAERKQARHILFLSLVVVLLLAVCLVVLFLLYRRHLALRTARQTIEQMNDSLLVANRVKEQLLGSLLCSQTDYLGEVEKYQQQVRRRAQEKKYEDLLTVPRSVDAKRQRDLFYNRLDEMLLSIFPTFVDDFNALLRPEEKIELKSGELLNTELRIFALMRLGITHNEVIAQVLDYSVNTIYTYKTRIKNKSDLPNDAFMDAVMRIPSFR